MLVKIGCFNVWRKINVHITAKGKLNGYYYYAKVYIWNKIKQCQFVVCKTSSGKNTIKIRFSFTNTILDQYTPKTIAYMQAQRFLVEHSIKESKQILGIN